MKKKNALEKVDLTNLSSFSNEEKREVLKNCYNNKEVLIKLRNSGLCYLIIGITLIIIGLIFIPIATVSLIDDIYFAYNSLEAIIVYLGCGVGGLLLIAGIVVVIISIVLNVKNNKKLKLLE